MSNAPTVPGTSTEIVLPDFLRTGPPVVFDDMSTAPPKALVGSISKDGDVVIKSGSDIIYRTDKLQAVIIGVGRPRACWEDPEVTDGTPPVCSSADGVKGCGKEVVPAGERSFVRLPRDQRDEWAGRGYDVGEDGCVLHDERDFNLEIPCSECHWSEYETAHRGKGQLCKQTVRLALYLPTFIPPSGGFKMDGTDKSHTQWLSDHSDEQPGGPHPAPVMFSITASSLKSWDAYVRWIKKAGKGQVAPWGFWTSIAGKISDKGGFKHGVISLTGSIMVAGMEYFYHEAVKLQDHAAMLNFNKGGTTDDYSTED